MVRAALRAGPHRSSGKSKSKSNRQSRRRLAQESRKDWKAADRRPGEKAKEKENGKRKRSHPIGQKLDRRKRKKSWGKVKQEFGRNWKVKVEVDIEAAGMNDRQPVLLQLFRLKFGRDSNRRSELPQAYHRLPCMILTHFLKPLELKQPILWEREKERRNERDWVSFKNDRIRETRDAIGLNNPLKWTCTWAWNSVRDVALLSHSRSQVTVNHKNTAKIFK